MNGNLAPNNGRFQRKVGNNLVLTTGSILIDSETGAPSFIAPSGVIETAELIRLIGDNFETGDLLPNIWTTGLTGSGTVTAITGEAVAMTGTTADSTAGFQTVNRARFVTATFNKAHLAVAMPGFSNTDVVREWGAIDLIDPTFNGDGVCFRNTSGVIQLIRTKAGANAEVVDEVDFNGDNPFIKNDNVNIYEIVYNAGTALFYQNRKLLHTMTFTDAVGYETVHLSVSLKVSNINGNTVDNTLKTRGFSCSRIGNASAVPDKFRITASGSDTIKNNPGILTRIIILDTGTGGASLELFDSATPGSNTILELNLTDSLVALDFGFEMNNGLSYTATGGNFEVLIVFE